MSYLEKKNILAEIRQTRPRWFGSRIESKRREMETSFFFFFLLQQRIMMAFIVRLEKEGNRRRDSTQFLLRPSAKIIENYVLYRTIIYKTTLLKKLSFFGSQ